MFDLLFCLFDSQDCRVAPTTTPSPRSQRRCVRRSRPSLLRTKSRYACMNRSVSLDECMFFMSQSICSSIFIMPRVSWCVVESLFAYCSTRLLTKKSPSDNLRLNFCRNLRYPAEEMGLNLWLYTNSYIRSAKNSERFSR